MGGPTADPPPPFVGGGGGGKPGGGATTDVSVGAADTIAPRRIAVVVDVAPISQGHRGGTTAATDQPSSSSSLMSNDASGSDPFRLVADVAIVLSKVYVLTRHDASVSDVEWTFRVVDSRESLMAMEKRFAAFARSLPKGGEHDVLRTFACQSQRHSQFRAFTSESFWLFCELLLRFAEHLSAQPAVMPSAPPPPTQPPESATASAAPSEASAKPTRTTRAIVPVQQIARCLSGMLSILGTQDHAGPSPWLLLFSDVPHTSETLCDFAPPPRSAAGNDGNAGGKPKAGSPSSDDASLAQIRSAFVRVCGAASAAGVAVKWFHRPRGCTAEDCASSPSSSSTSSSILLQDRVASCIPAASLIDLRALCPLSALFTGPAAFARLTAAHVAPCADEPASVMAVTVRMPSAYTLASQPTPSPRGPGGDAQGNGDAPSPFEGHLRGCEGVSFTATLGFVRCDSSDRKRSKAFFPMQPHVVAATLPWEDAGRLVGRVRMEGVLTTTMQEREGGGGGGGGEGSEAFGRLMRRAAHDRTLVALAPEGAPQGSDELALLIPLPGREDVAVWCGGLRWEDISRGTAAGSLGSARAIGLAPRATGSPFLLAPALPSSPLFPLMDGNGDEDRGDRKRDAAAFSEGVKKTKVLFERSLKSHRLDLRLRAPNLSARKDRAADVGSQGEFPGVAGVGRDGRDGRAVGAGVAGQETRNVGGGGSGVTSPADVDKAIQALVASGRLELASYLKTSEAGLQPQTVAHKLAASCFEGCGRLGAIDRGAQACESLLESQKTLKARHKGAKSPGEKAMKLREYLVQILLRLEMHNGAASRQRAGDARPDVVRKEVRAMLGDIMFQLPAKVVGTGVKELLQQIAPKYLEHSGSVMQYLFKSFGLTQREEKAINKAITVKKREEPKGKGKRKKGAPKEREGGLRQEPPPGGKGNKRLCPYLVGNPIRSSTNAVNLMRQVCIKIRRSGSNASQAAELIAKTPAGRHATDADVVMETPFQRGGGHAEDGTEAAAQVVVKDLTIKRNLLASLEDQVM